RRIDDAGPGSSGRNRGDDRLSEVLLQSFVPAEEEDLVPAQRSACDAAVLMPRERRRLADVEVVARVHLAVAEELEAGSVQLVAAGLGGDVDDAAHRAAVVGGER